MRGFHVSLGTQSQRLPRGLGCFQGGSSSQSGLPRPASGHPGTCEKYKFLGLLPGLLNPALLGGWAHQSRGFMSWSVRTTAVRQSLLRERRKGSHTASGSQTLVPRSTSSGPGHPPFPPGNRRLNESGGRPFVYMKHNNIRSLFH